MSRTLCRRLHLNADSSGSLTQSQDGVVLASVQPVDSQFSAGGPFHHGDIILPPGKQESENACPALTTSVLTSLKVPYYTVFHVSDIYKHVSEVFGSKYQTDHCSIP